MGGQGDRPGVRGTAFKSRLCTRFMQKGECSYGPTCHFAHGYEDMQTGDRNPMVMSFPCHLTSFNKPLTAIQRQKAWQQLGSPKPGLLLSF